MTPQLTADHIHDHVLKACRDGNAMSFKLLYEQYARAMYNTSLRIVNNPADAEDVLQEAFLDAFRNLERFEFRSGFGSWLKRIVVNKSINYVRRKNSNWIELQDHHDLFVENEIDENEMEFKLEEVRRCIQKLPDGYRTILCLHLIENYKQETIADILGVSHTTVRTQYMRAKKKLLELLKQGGIS
ncbi:MAG: sigma-70 family polymerase sigma factor [Chitinophagaceae bacterium]|nr:sigma-70 family polymerase sigma factor [Chitinophagaceae bacterium]